MRVAALYDIHGNLPALRAVLADAGRAGADTFVIGGDVAAGPMPRETIDQLIALSGRARFVRGNSDREMVDAYDRGEARGEAPASSGSDFAASQISRTHRDFLAAFAPTVGLEIDGIGPTLFCHGSPRSDEEIITRITPDDRLREMLEPVDAQLVVGGHTHQQFDRTVDGWRVVNAGSVGVPYEGIAGAYWVLLGPTVELRRTEYDVEQGMNELRGSGYPDLEEMFGDSLVEPADPLEVAEFFERQATTGI